MKKLHSFLFYALVTPAITFGAGSLMAEQATTQNGASQQQSSELDKDGQKSSLSDQNSQGQDSGQTGSMTATGSTGTGADQTDSMAESDRMQNRGYLDSAPVNGTQSSDLIGATVRTNTDDDIGSVNELIIDESGQILAILVSVGGFLGMGEKDVAIGWDHVTLSGTADDKELRVDVTDEDLRTAPKYAIR